MKLEQDDSDLMEVVTVPQHSTFYGDHAVSAIVDYLRRGEVPQKGTQAWY